MDGIDLKKLIPSEQDLSKKTTWVEFKGIKFKLRYVSRASLMKLAESSMIAGYDPKAKGRIRNVNVDKYIDQVFTSIVVGWDNCTLRTLSNIMPLNLNGTPEEKLDEAVEFTTENMLATVKNVHDLDNFLQECAVDAALFKHPNDEELTKNLPSSPSGTSTP
jgi:hypothetical protein